MSYNYYNVCVEASLFFSWPLANCPTFSDVFLNSDGKLFYDMLMN